MKRLSLLILIALTLFVSCTAKYDILSYQDNDIVATCNINEKYTATITKAKDYSALEILSPSELLGTTIYLYKNEAYIQNGDLKIPVSMDKLTGICAILSCFSLEEATLTTVESQNKSSIVTFSCENATYTVTYGQNKLPCHFEINGETFNYSIEVCSIKLVASH